MGSRLFPFHSMSPCPGRLASPSRRRLVDRSTGMGTITPRFGLHLYKTMTLDCPTSLLVSFFLLFLVSLSPAFFPLVLTLLFPTHPTPAPPFQKTEDNSPTPHALSRLSPLVSRVPRVSLCAVLRCISNRLLFDIRASAHPCIRAFA